MNGRPLSSPIEAYAAGVRGWARVMPTNPNVHVLTDASGLCEREIEMLAAPIVARLSMAEAYRIGRAMRYIGFVLDQERQPLETVERVHRFLVERSSDRDATGEMYTAEHVADDFLSRFGAQLSKDALWLRGRLLRYVDTEVGFRYSDDALRDVGTHEAEQVRRAMAGYSHPRVEILERQLLPAVPSFHVSGALYDELEGSGWTVVGGPLLIPGIAFAIVVDGEHFVPLTNDPSRLARTEYLLVDARTTLWTVSERIWIRETSGGNDAVQILGVEWNSDSGDKAALVADASYEITGRIVSRWDLPEREQNRMVRVALGFRALLLHRHVTLKRLPTAPGEVDTFRVAISRGTSVDRIVGDVNKGRKLR